MDEAIAHETLFGASLQLASPLRTQQVCSMGIVMTAPPLKTEPKYGYFPWWPEDGDDWVHPEDVPAARSMIPSERVFRRDGTSGPYSVLHYDKARLRVRRTLWQEVRPPKFEIGDCVEVLSRGLKNAPGTGTVQQIFWDSHAKDIRYQIVVGNLPLEQWYGDDDLQRVEPTRA
jgi:hypothetical protein